MRELYDFSKKLKDLRELYGYTQKYVAEKIGVKYQSYQAYEKGISIPSFLHVIELADLFDVSLDYFAGRKEI